MLVVQKGESLPYLEADGHTHSRSRSDNTDTGHGEGVDYTVRRSSKKHEKRIIREKKREFCFNCTRRGPLWQRT